MAVQSIVLFSLRQMAIDIQPVPVHSSKTLTLLFCEFSIIFSDSSTSYSVSGRGIKIGVWSVF
jgi:hypothetical protein